MRTLLCTIVTLLAIATSVVDAFGYFGADIPGNDISPTLNTNSDTNCAIACDNNPSCVAWSWDVSGSGNCWLKSTVGNRVSVNNRVSGVRVGQLNVDRIGGDMPGMPLNLGSTTASGCAAKCQTTSGCVAWSFDSCGKSSCWLKSSIPTNTAGNTCRVSAIQGTFSTDRSGGDLTTVTLSASATATECATQCANYAGCTAWSMVQPGQNCELANTCWLKGSSSQPASAHNCRMSGSLPSAATSSPATSKPATSAPATSAPVTSAPVTSKPATSAPVTGGKLGLAWSYTEWNGASNVNAVAGSGKKTSWYYTWSPWSVQVNKQTGAEFVPMFHDPDNLSQWNQAKNAGEFNGCKYALGLNEPDLNGWTVTTAVNIHKANLEPLRSSGIKLGAPAIISDLSRGKPWLSDFLSQCSNSACRVDFITLHWYGVQAQDFINYVTTMHNAFPTYPIWVTEWACLSTDQNFVYGFMGQTTLWMDQQSYITRYSYFGAMRNVAADTGNYVPMTNSLITTDGKSLTSLGNQYFVIGGHQ